MHKGVANGTRCFVHKVHLKMGQSTKLIQFGCNTVLAVSASQVEKITFRHERDDVVSLFFDLEAELHTFKISVPIPSGLMVGHKNVKQSNAEEFNFRSSATMQQLGTNSKALPFQSCLFTLGSTSETGFALFFQESKQWMNCS